MSDLIDRQALKNKICDCCEGKDEWCNGPCFEIMIIDSMPAIAASPWHRVEEDPPNEMKYAIFYYEWTGIRGTVYRETSIVSLGELKEIGCRPIAWMEKPEPPKEDA